VQIYRWIRVFQNKSALFFIVFLTTIRWFKQSIDLQFVQFNIDLFEVCFFCFQHF
jgi:hypothetical protein